MGRRGRIIAGAAVGGAAVGAVVRRRRKKKDGSGSESCSDSSDDEDNNGPRTFAMREKLLLTIGDNWKINRMYRNRERGEPAYFANNKVLRVRETFELQTLERETLYQIQDRVARVRDAMAIEDANGDKVAEIKKKVIGIVRDNFVVKVREDTDWIIHGTVLEHDYTIKENGRRIVMVHKKWIAPIQDCYFIDIEPGVDEGLALSVCIALEAMDDE